MWINAIPGTWEKNSLNFSNETVGVSKSEVKSRSYNICGFRQLLAKYSKEANRIQGFVFGIEKETKSSLMLLCKLWMRGPWGKSWMGMAGGLSGWGAALWERVGAPG